MKTPSNAPCTRWQGVVSKDDDVYSVDGCRSDKEVVSFHLTFESAYGKSNPNTYRCGLSHLYLLPSTILSLSVYLPIDFESQGICLYGLIWVQGGLLYPEISRHVCYWGAWTYQLRPWYCKSAQMVDNRAPPNENPVYVHERCTRLESHETKWTGIRLACSNSKLLASESVSSLLYSTK